MLCVEFEKDHYSHELRTLSKMLEDVNKNKQAQQKEINEIYIPDVSQHIGKF